MVQNDIPAVILAGGQGRRIGGAKAQVLLGGKPLWRYVYDRVAPQVGRVAVNAAKAFDGQDVIADEVPGLGPLGGVLAAMVWAEQQGAGRVLTVAVDTPFLPLDLVERLRVDGRIVVAETADGRHGTTALWDVRLAGDLRGALAEGTRKVTDWAEGVGVTSVMFADGGAFFNVNTQRGSGSGRGAFVNGFDTVVMVDWSARSAPSPAKPTKDAIFIGLSRGGREAVTYHRTRHAAVRALTGLLDGELRAARRVLVGFDFPFGYPRGFARAVTGRDDPFAVWEWLAEAIEDDPRNRNNRWEVAARLNAMFPGVGPFWGCPAGVASEALPARGSLRRGHGIEERREVEKRLPRAQPCWKLFTTGSVGSQVLMGLPHVQGLRERYGAALSVSPFEAPETPIVLAEIYPGLIDAAIKARAQKAEILDRAQVRLVARAFAALEVPHLAEMLQEGTEKRGGSWALAMRRR